MASSARYVLYGTHGEYPEGIFTEPEDFSSDTLANLGPLRLLAGE
jgi:hypothetical protein